MVVKTSSTLATDLKIILKSVIKLPIVYNNFFSDEKTSM